MVTTFHMESIPSGSQKPWKPFLQNWSFRMGQIWLTRGLRMISVDKEGPVIVVLLKHSKQSFVRMLYFVLEPDVLLRCLILFFLFSVRMGYKEMASVVALRVSKELLATSVQTQTSMEKTVMKVCGSDSSWEQPWCCFHQPRKPQANILTNEMKWANGNWVSGFCFVLFFKNNVRFGHIVSHSRLSGKKYLWIGYWFSPVYNALQ